MQHEAFDYNERGRFAVEIHVSNPDEFTFADTYKTLAAAIASVVSNGLNASTGKNSGWVKFTVRVVEWCTLTGTPPIYYWTPMKYENHYIFSFDTIAWTVFQDHGNHRMIYIASGQVNEKI